MAIKRNEAEEPQWKEWDYAVRSKKDLFFASRWKDTVNWDIILRHVEKMQQASQMIDINLYPSKLFFAALDLLEANLYVVDDLFYYLTGVRMTGTSPMSEEVQNRLGFWNMDCHKVLKQISEGLEQIQDPLIGCLKMESLRDVCLKVIEKWPLVKHLLEDGPIREKCTEEYRAYTYACDCYEADEVDEDALVSQIDNILKLADDFAYFFSCIYRAHIAFSKLLAMFKQSEKAQTEYIEPWRHDFGGTRDGLIAKMEKDAKLGPWVHRYDHLPKNRNVAIQLFYGEELHLGPVDIDECYNTNNWLSILTVAAVLQEYDEQHGASSTVKADEDEHDEVLVQLLPYFKTEEAAKRFLNSVRQMKKDRDITGMVNKNYACGHCTNTSIDLWRVLHEAGIYKTGYANWNKNVFRKRSVE